METEKILQELKMKFDEDIISVLTGNSKRITLNVDPNALINISLYLLKTLNSRFIIASAVHTKKGFEIFYHFSLDRIGLVMNLHVILRTEHPEIESLANSLEAANWIEREMHELFGINFLHHPNQEKLLSEGNWAEGVYPYRKNFIENIPENKK